MKKLKWSAVVFMLLWFLSAAAAENPPAENSNPKTPPKAAASSEVKMQTNAGFDIILLMDSSGSMRKNDPQNYRKDAAKLLISLLSENDSVGIVSFGDSAKTLLPLTRNTKGNRNGLFRAISMISSKEFSTNIQEGVRKGYEDIRASSGKDRILVLMSDGKLTLGSREKEEAANAELSRLLPELSKVGVKLYSVAFTESSDMNFLEDLARRTGGFFKLAVNDKDIHVVFTSIFEKMKSPDTVPLEGDTFSVDKDIKEVILVISKKSGTTTVVIDPSGKKHSSKKHEQNIQWYESKLFDMITVKEPAAGKWKVSLSTKEGNRVFIITNLNLKSSFDRSFVNKNDRIRIDAWLEKDGGMLMEKDVLDKIVFFADIVPPEGNTARINLLDNGQSGDESAGDGKYTGEFAADTIGEYTVRLIAESKTFKREKTFQFKSAEPQPGQKTTPEPAAKKSAEAGYVSWKPVIIKFGIINLAAAAVIVVFYLTRKIGVWMKNRPKTKTKIKTKNKKRK